jgi:hypothetical protein
MSVFRASNQEGVPLSDDLYVEGPTERLFDTERFRAALPTDPGKGAGFAIVMSLVALLVAAGAALIGWRALAMSLARPATVAMQVGASPTAGVEHAVESYTVFYTGQSMKLQAGCNASMSVDLDEPRANVAQPDGDLRYDVKCGRDGSLFSLGPGAQGGSQIAGSPRAAQDCSQAIRTSPLGPGASVAVRKGNQLCVLTVGSTPRMVLVRITDVTSGSIASLTLTAWSVPGR